MEAASMMTIVTHVRIDPGKEPAWDDAFRTRAAAAKKQPGWTSVQAGVERAPAGLAGPAPVPGIGAKSGGVGVATARPAAPPVVVPTVPDAVQVTLAVVVPPVCVTVN